MANPEARSFDIEEGKHRQQEELSKSRNVVAIGMIFFRLDTCTATCFGQDLLTF